MIVKCLSIIDVFVGHLRGLINYHGIIIIIIIIITIIIIIYSVK